MICRATYRFAVAVPIEFIIERDGRRLHLAGRPDTRQFASAFGGEQAAGVLGVAVQAAGRAPVNVLEALSLGAAKTWDVTESTGFYLSRIVTGQVGADQLHSFVGIAVGSGAMTQQAVDQARVARVSWVAAVADVLIQLAAMLSVSMGILNLLPIPVLDGGHLLSFAYEAIARRPPAAVVQAAGYRAGLA